MFADDSGSIGGYGSPANAGIDLIFTASDGEELGFPRQRGDRPASRRAVLRLCGVPPPTRG